MIDDKDTRVTSLKIANVHVYRIGEILTLLEDAGFEVEINLSKSVPEEVAEDVWETTARTDDWAAGYESGYGAGVLDHTTQTNTPKGWKPRQDRID